MSKFKVLITDYAWPDLDLERSLLGAIDAEIIEAAEGESLESLADDADAILTCWARVPDSVIVAAKKCQIVARFGIGLDNIDLDCCSRLNIPVVNVPDYCSQEVAEHTLAQILSLARNIAFFHAETKQGRYDLKAGPPLRRLAGQTLGIIGLGSIGRRVAELASAIGMKVIATSRAPKQIDGIAWCTLDDLLSRSDYVSLHLPLTDETRHMIGAAQFERMKPTAFLINTSRGPLIDHDALAAALEGKQIAGAAIDVQEPEPPDLSLPPFNDPRVIVTPHAAFMSAESLRELRTRAVGQVVTRLTGGVPEHIVNGGQLNL